MGLFQRFRCIYRDRANDRKSVGFGVKRDERSESKSRGDRLLELQEILLRDAYRDCDELLV